MSETCLGWQSRTEAQPGTQVSRLLGRDYSYVPTNPLLCLCPVSPASMSTTYLLWFSYWKSQRTEKKKARTEIVGRAKEDHRRQPRGTEALKEDERNTQNREAEVQMTKMTGNHFKILYREYDRCTNRCAGELQKSQKTVSAKKKHIFESRW